MAIKNVEDYSWVDPQCLGISLKHIQKVDGINFPFKWDPPQIGKFLGYPQIRGCAIHSKGAISLFILAFSINYE